MSFNNNPVDGNANFSSFESSAFEFAFKPHFDVPSGPYYDQQSVPLRATKSSNAVSFPSVRSRQSIPLMRSHSGFDLTDSRAGFDSNYLLQTGPVPHFPGPQSAQSRFPGQPSSLRINQYLNDSDPWVPIPAGQVLKTPRKGRVSAHFVEPSFDFRTYREQPQSEIESNFTAHYASDSGYASHPAAPQSERSGEYSIDSPDFTGIGPSFDNLDLFSMPGTASLAQPGQTEGVAMKATPRSRGGKKKCEKCNEMLKCPSDYRKHMLKHDKPNKCDVMGCTRVDGFSTINDLLRHKKSKHAIGLDSITTSFKCASPSCKNQEKIWPRRDNFKQHIIRMHKEEDVTDLISRSEIKSSTSTDGASNQSLDADLAGMDSKSRYAEAPSFTVRPGELDMGISDTTGSADASAWPHPNLSGDIGAHRLAPNAVRERSIQNLINHSGSYKVQSRNLSEQNLDSLATVAAFQTPIDPTGATSSLGNGYSSNVSSNLASPIRLDYSGPRTQQIFGDPNLLEDLVNIRARFHVASKEDREKMLECLGSEVLGRRESENDDGSSGSSPDPPARARQHDCAQCGKGFAKKASLNKHMQRHTRPWACTHLACGKMFGAKDDWKRHERSQAPQSILWYCQIPDATSSSGNCAFVEYERSEFEEHLKEDHSMTSSVEIDNKANECKIGFSHQWANAYYAVNFWCGFCKKVIQADHDPHKSAPHGSGNGKGQDDNDPANHRWDHIDAHFKDGLTMDSWHFWEANMTNVEIRAEGRNKDAKFLFGIWGSSKEKFRRKERERPRIDVTLPGDSNNPKKRKAESELVKGKKSNTRHQRVRFWNCCQCLNGPLSTNLHDRCPGECSHQRCRSCPGDESNDGGEAKALLQGPYDAFGDGNMESDTAIKKFEKLERVRAVHNRAECVARYTEVN